MARSLLSSLKPLAGTALQLTLNRALALDPDTRSALAALDGRHIALTLESPALAMRIGVDGERLTVGPVDPQQEPDLAVRSTLGGVLAQLPFLANARRGGDAPAGRVKVSGDAELARRLQQLATRFDPDWQQPFVRVFGERDVVPRAELDAFHDDVDVMRDDVERLAVRVQRLRQVGA